MRFVFWVRWLRGLATQGYPPLRQYAQSGMIGRFAAASASLGMGNMSEVAPGRHRCCTAAPVKASL